MQSQRFHYIVDLDHCNDKVRDPEALKIFIAKAAEVTNMKVVAGPFAVEGVPENPGFTSICIVDFSHISVHTFTKYDEVMVDVFSCRPYDRERVLTLCKEYFSTPETVVREKEVWWGN